MSMHATNLDSRLLTPREQLWRAAWLFCAWYFGAVVGTLMFARRLDLGALNPITQAALTIGAIATPWANVILAIVGLLALFYLTKPRWPRWICVGLAPIFALIIQLVLRFSTTRS